ncbi:alanine racemase [Caloranaerobacter azorensis H53214]|uniref:Alanine racemase n=2 Tax=Caloranaerobacter azorensis TaxID=116090 RepID=A0A1M5TJW9_9FIRM|nr:alanine racemase [Caloranaerobacter azorensis]KGG80522.1 alanine racemase [Caloranaerobacter azorensis H53214]SHH50971.1 alanine racemase [Caloranaerobacter azorensis DSM 13643]
MSSLTDIRPVWAEINLDHLAHNIKEVKRVVKDGTLITAVVKANAYGHGAIKAAETFINNDADRLAVATLSEAIELRKAGFKVPILILGYTPECQFEKVIKYDIIQTIYTYEHGVAFSKVAERLGKIGIMHIKIDTGMNRLGFEVNKHTVEQICRICQLPYIEVEGIFTHFAVADEKDKTFTRRQFNEFKGLIEELEKRGIKIPIKHVSNSAAIIDLPEYNLDMVRAGIMLYGLYPSDYVNKSNVDLKPVMTLKTKISHLKTVPKGMGISYGLTYVTAKESKIGTLPIGYADGFTRILTGKAEVVVKDKRVKVVGRICMDQCMVDLTEVEDVNIGDEVVLFGDGINSLHIDEIAKKLGTINYEIVCMVSRRVPRVYVKNGEIVEVVDYLLDR